MPDFFSQSCDFTQNVQVKSPVEAPLAFACHRTFDVHAPSILTTALILVSLLHRLFLFFSLVLQIGMKFVNPLAVYVKKKNWVRIALLVIKTLKFCNVYWVVEFLVPKYRASLRVNCTNINSLLHALERHSEQKEPRYLQSHWQINKDLAKRSDFWLIFFLHGNTLAFFANERRRNRKSSSVL